MFLELISTYYAEYKFVVRLISALAIVCAILFVAYKYWLFILNHYNNMKTVFKYSAHILLDFLVSCMLVHVGYSSYILFNKNMLLDDKSGSTEIGTWAFVSFALVGIIKFIRYRKYSIGTGSQIVELHKNRADLGVMIDKFNKEKPPSIKKGSMARAELKLITEILKKHIAMLEKLLMLDFGYSPFERFTVTLLFYKKSTDEWIKHGTVNSKGEIEGVKNTHWPKNKGSFQLRNELYTMPYDAITTFDTFDITGKDYESVLSIPLYFPTGAKSNNYAKDDLYAVISYATNRKGYFSKLDAGKFMNFFLLERAIIDRTAYRILRRFYDK